MDILKEFPIWTILTGAGVLIGIIAAWFIIERMLNPTSAHMKEPDIVSRLTGTCGDTMEIRLKIKNGTVTSASYWASGCGPSAACAAMATKLARGKSIEDIPIEIDYETIAKAVGGLPEDQLHCAALASETLNDAAHHYLVRYYKKDQ